jgi:hypothetical protein
VVKKPVANERKLYDVIAIDSEEEELPLFKKK